MKKLFVAAICVLAGVAVFLFYKSSQSAPATGVSASQNQSSGPNAVSTGLRSSNSASPAEAPAANGAPGASPASSAPQPQDLSARAGQYVPPAGDTNLPPDAVLRNLRRAVRQYGQMFGGDPVGNNQEITAELMGKNPKQINFLTGQDGMSVNQNGELVDAWGTPYFFHQLSGSDMEVRSAGPDRRMWTSDDLVTR